MNIIVLFALLALAAARTAPRKASAGTTQQVSGTSGTIASANYGSGSYLKSTKSRWVITLTQGSTVKFHFDSPFNVENKGSTGCYDSVRILDISQQSTAVCASSATTLAVLCGQTAPEDHNVVGTQAILEFCSDASVQQKGFQVEWTAQGVNPTPIPTNGPTAVPFTGTSGPITCGQQAPEYPPIDVLGQQRIVGGEHANPHSWPWAVAIMQDFGGGDWEVYCGGTVVAPHFIVTAGHCFADVDESEWPSFFLKVGADNRGNTGSTNEPSQQIAKIQKAIVHPEYDPGSGSSGPSYDVTLIRLAADLTFNDFVRPLCLPSDSDALGNGTNTVVIGWGTTTEGGDEPLTLQQVVVPIVDTATCNKDYSNAITDTMICAGLQNTGGKDSCQGDSGGALMWKKPDDAKWYLEGIVSWGQGCAEKGYPGVYSRAAALVDWVTKTMQSTP